MSADAPVVRAAWTAIGYLTMLAGLVLAFAAWMVNPGWRAAVVTVLVVPVCALLGALLIGITDYKNRSVKDDA